MFVVLYRWRLKPELADSFVENWAAITKHYVDHFGSLGSRLHRGNDGLYYAYAQWPSFAARAKAFLDGSLEPARERMNQAVEERFADVVLEVVEDHIVSNAR